MKITRLNRVVSLIVLVCFLLNSVMLDLALASNLNAVKYTDNLAPASMFSNLRGQQPKDMAQIRAALEYQLGLTLGEVVKPMDPMRLLSQAERYAQERFDISGVRFFYQEMFQLPSGRHYLVKCRFQDANTVKPRIYYAAFSLDHDTEGLFPVEVYTEHEFNNKGIRSYLDSVRSLPKRSEFNPRGSKKIEDSPVRPSLTGDRLVVMPDKDSLVKAVARRMVDEVKNNPEGVVLGFFTGGTPIPIYEEVIRITREEKVDWSNVTTFNLDEYLGIDPAHHERYRNYMNRNLFDGLVRYGRLDIEKTHVPDILPGETPRRAMERYNDMIARAGYVKTWFIGIGRDGHFAFLEPAIVIRPEEFYRLFDSDYDHTDISDELVKRVRDFNEFVITEDLAVGYADIRKVLLNILYLQDKARTNLGIYEDLIQGRIESSKKYGREISVKNAKSELNILGGRMLNLSESIFYVPLSGEERSRLKKDILDLFGINATILGMDDYFGSQTKVVSLAIPTLIDNSRYFDNINRVPLKALTATGVVRKSDAIVQVVTNPAMAEGIQCMLESVNATPECASTVLMEHPKHQIVTTEEVAASLNPSTREKFEARGSMSGNVNIKVEGLVKEVVAKGDHLAVLKSDGYLTLFDLRTGKPVDGCINIESREGFALTETHLVTVAVTWDIEVRDIRTGKVLEWSSRITRSPEAYLSPTELACHVGPAGVLNIYNLSSGELRTLPMPQHLTGVISTSSKKREDLKDARWGINVVRRDRKGLEISVNGLKSKDDIRASMTGSESPFKKLDSIGQKIWIDGLTWEMIESGEFESLVREHNITGVTTNPALIKEYLKSDVVAAKIQQFFRQGLDRDRIYYEIIKDLAFSIASIFHRYRIAGKFSIELSPFNADNFEASMAEAGDWLKINAEIREALETESNFIMVKVPANETGYRLIEEITARGGNVTTTLIFDDEQYRKTAEAYVRGLARADASGIDLSKIYSVAAFFLSRWDTAVAKSIPVRLQGRIAISIAIKSYNETFKRIFGSEEFLSLAKKGANVQGFLLASTGSKKDKMPPEHQKYYYEDMYVRPLMGRHVVNTLPYSTIIAIKGRDLMVSQTITEGYKWAVGDLEDASKYIDLNLTSSGLFKEGMDLFKSAYSDIMRMIDELIEEAGTGTSRPSMTGTGKRIIAKAVTEDPRLEEKNPEYKELAEAISDSFMAERYALLCYLSEDFPIDMEQWRSGSEINFLYKGIIRGSVKGNLIRKIDTKAGADVIKLLRLIAEGELDLNEVIYSLAKRWEPIISRVTSEEFCKNASSERTREFTNMHPEDIGRGSMTGERINLDKFAGFPAELDLKSGRMILGGLTQGVTYERETARPLSEMGTSLLDAGQIKKNPDRVIYRVYRGVNRNIDHRRIYNYSMEFDITVIEPGVIGEEFIMTKGHTHAGNSVEFCEVWHGLALFVQQGRNPLTGDTEFIATLAKPGEKVFLVPGYSHRTINVGKDVLVMADWMNVDKKSNSGFDFSEFERHGGTRYNVIKKADGSIEFRHNPSYGEGEAALRLALPREVIDVDGLQLFTTTPLYDVLYDGRAGAFSVFLETSRGFDKTYGAYFNFVKEETFNSVLRKEGIASDRIGERASITGLSSEDAMKIIALHYSVYNKDTFTLNGLVDSYATFCGVLALPRYAKDEYVRPHILSAVTGLIESGYLKETVSDRFDRRLSGDDNPRYELTKKAMALIAEYPHNIRAGRLEVPNGTFTEDIISHPVRLVRASITGDGKGIVSYTDIERIGVGSLQELNKGLSFADLESHFYGLAGMALDPDINAIGFSEKSPENNDFSAIRWWPLSQFHMKLDLAAPLVMEHILKWAGFRGTNRFNTGLIVYSDKRNGYGKMIIISPDDSQMQGVKLNSPRVKIAEDKIEPDAEESSLILIPTVRGSMTGDSMDRIVELTGLTESIAQEAGRMVYDDISSMYTLVVDANIYRADELSRDMVGYDFGSMHVGAQGRFNITKVNTADVDNIIANIQGQDSSRVIVQLSNVLSADDLAKLKAKAPNARIIYVDTTQFGREITDKDARWQYRFDLYALMLTARRITAEDMQDKANPLYRTLAFLLDFYSKDEVSVADAYIEALVKDDKSFIIGHALSYKPASRVAMPNAVIVAAPLISA